MGLTRYWPSLIHRARPVRMRLEGKFGFDRDTVTLCIVLHRDERLGSMSKRSAHLAPSARAASAIAVAAKI